MVDFEQARSCWWLPELEVGCNQWLLVLQVVCRGWQQLVATSNSTQQLM